MLEVTTRSHRQRTPSLGEHDRIQEMGFHLPRHPFSSNLARAGVDDRVIDHFMGHQTEEMRRRYPRW
jgi:site-specific recombinase XerD